MYDLSIVLPTCDRAELLEDCLSSISNGTQCNYQVIVVDGASIDRTASVLTEAREDMGDRLVTIREDKREGFVKAANRGFAVAEGKYTVWLNDDARPLNGSLDAAVDQLNHSDDSVGMLALFHHWHSQGNIAYETMCDNRLYRLLHVRGTLYANFGMAPTSLIKDLGCFDERYYLNAADPDFSMKVWHSGKQIVPAYSAMIDHDEHEDGRRIIDFARGREDNDRFFAKWDLPPINPLRNDFSPMSPCTLRGIRQAISVAA